MSSTRTGSPAYMTEEITIREDEDGTIALIIKSHADRFPRHYSLTVKQAEKLREDLKCRIDLMK